MLVSSSCSSLSFFVFFSMVLRTPPAPPSNPVTTSKRWLMFDFTRYLLKKQLLDQSTMSRMVSDLMPLPPTVSQFSSSCSLLTCYVKTVWDPSQFLIMRIQALVHPRRCSKACKLPDLCRPHPESTLGNNRGLHIVFIVFLISSIWIRMKRM